MWEAHYFLLRVDFLKLGNSHRRFSTPCNSFLLISCWWVSWNRWVNGSYQNWNSQWSGAKMRMIFRPMSDDLLKKWGRWLIIGLYFWEWGRWLIICLSNVFDANDLSSAWFLRPLITQQHQNHIHFCYQPLTGKIKLSTS